MYKDYLDRVVKEIGGNYQAEEIFFTNPDECFPSRKAVIEILQDIRRLMFPGYFGQEVPNGTRPEYFIGDMLGHIDVALHQQLMAALTFRHKDTLSEEEIARQADTICVAFLEKLPRIQELLLKDVQAAFDGDPAALSKEDIIFSYPGFFAVSVYRIAHELYVMDVPMIPRIMSEYAHSGTGIDINPGAEIGEYFFMDHGTGIVIGETTKIGNHVKLYQGVTLGALSTRKGQALRGVKRHPTIEDNVTIYSNASVLGGETVIGEGSVIGGSAFVTESVPKNGRVSVKKEISVRTAKPKPKPESSFELPD